MVNDVNKTHTALRWANVHGSRSGPKQKAWIPLEKGIVKWDMRQDMELVVTLQVAETVERIHIATPVLLLALTLQGLCTDSHAGKVDSDMNSTRWLAGEVVSG